MHAVEWSHFVNHALAPQKKKKQNTDTYKNGHVGRSSECTQMFCDFNHVHGQVISAKHTTFTHAEAPLRTAIDLEEWSSKYRTEDPNRDAETSK